MKPLYSKKQFDNAKADDKLPCRCYICNIIFYTNKKLIKYEIKSNLGKIKFCSQACNYISQSTKQKVNCKQCNILFDKLPNQIKKSLNHFCSKSCNATYQNTHKTTGNRRSKLEIWLEEQLTTLYPKLKIHYNRKDTINSELDIYIPSLKLAIELNGIFHYEPIYGDKKLNQTKINDSNKFQKCIEKHISLCIIDVSKQSYFKVKTSQQFLDIITNIISKNLLTS